MTLRTYWPKPEVNSGQWTPPPVVKVSNNCPVRFWHKADISPLPPEASACGCKADTPSDVSRAPIAVRWSRKPLVGDEEASACQTPVAHHQVLHALGFPLASTLRWDALPREPLRNLAIVVADLSHRSLDERSVGVSVIIGQLDDGSGAATRQGTRLIARHSMEAHFGFFRQFQLPSHKCRQPTCCAIYVGSTRRRQTRASR
jgi:hypothetical protein